MRRFQLPVDTNSTESNTLQDQNSSPAAPARRVFLGRASVAALSGAGLVTSHAAAAAAITAEDQLPPNVPRWMKEPGAGFLNPAYGLPSPFEKSVVRKLPDQPAAFPTATRTPLQDLFGATTPNGLFFERHHAGVPAIDPAQHRLMVHGLVDRPLLLNLKELKRFPAVTRSHFIECSGNSMAEFKSPGKGSVQDIHGLLSGADWTGARLSDVLAEAGLQTGAAWLLAEGADAAAMSRSIPLAKALEDTLLVYGQNGEMLRPEQGYPLRLLVPGYEGNMNIKWLRRIKVGDAPFQTREETAKYTDLMRDGSARQFTFSMGVKSVITSPSAHQLLGEHGFHEISGLAWSGHGRIRQVEVSTDGGRSWRTAELDGPVQSRALTRFRLPWRWSGNEAVLQSRALDEAGNLQPTRQALLGTDGQNSIYHYNAIQSWNVGANGEVSNVHA
jgi:sulfane dehydrogenase subunit SoxC